MGVVLVSTKLMGLTRAICTYGLYIYIYIVVIMVCLMSSLETIVHFHFIKNDLLLQ
jgi:hypothetical protein